MRSDFTMVPKKLEKKELLGLMQDCNQITERFGLSLSDKQIQNLEEHRIKALQNTGRIEFGEGILKKLAYAFCDSPFLLPNSYEETLIELQDLFYYFKTESMERISDDELIEAMKEIYNGKAQGSLSYLSQTALEDLCRNLRFDSFDSVDGRDPEE
ncbi:DUF6323 family protein [Caproicibacterium sp. BJN0003]|uniref:DUF6323 family protein n=1 Tax=Caproicibacterium sp. BJN0003 TaxID=2994078 RepID=UPI0022514F79|nr:DUF6323 family protein [Caproicibacterium sp. BJN0003]UZT81443.1 DUF6323 family protein [Caproicibacterium sp. BJN0003]